MAPTRECGSHAQYLRHLKSGEDCDVCRTAESRRMREFRATRPDQRERDRKQSLVREEAMRRLMAAHRSEYDQYVYEERRRMFAPQDVSA